MISDLELRIAALERGVRCARNAARRLVDLVDETDQNQSFGFPTLWTRGVSCSYADLPNQLRWSQQHAAGLSTTVLLTKVSDFSLFMDLTDADLAILTGKRGWIGPCEPAQVGRGTAYRLVYESATGVYRLEHAFGGIGCPYLAGSPNLGRENFATTQRCFPSFRLTGTSAYFGAIVAAAS